MAAESCRRLQHDVTTRRHDDDDDDDVIGDYSGHLSVARPTPAVTHQSAAREPGRRGVWSEDTNTSGSWSQPNRKSTKPEMANSGDVEIGQLYWSMCIVSAQLLVSARL